MDILEVIQFFLKPTDKLSDLLDEDMLEDCSLMDMIDVRVVKTPAEQGKLSLGEFIHVVTGVSVYEQQ